jgi:hypothetical protein
MLHVSSSHCYLFTLPDSGLPLGWFIRGFMIESENAKFLTGNTRPSDRISATIIGCQVPCSHSWQNGGVRRNIFRTLFDSARVLVGARTHVYCFAVALMSLSIAGRLHASYVVQCTYVARHRLQRLAEPI